MKCLIGSENKSRHFCPSFPRPAFVPLHYNNKNYPIMLLTTRQEIEIFLPTSVQESAQSILTLAEDAEETYLLPVLGRPLFNHVNELYQEVSLDEDWYLPKNGEQTPPEQRLIRLCQEVVLYMTLANNAGLFSVSMNDAGLNTPSTQGYEEADEKRIDRFVKDAFKKGHRAIDRLLLFLEEDAVYGDCVFTELWQKSKYFFRNHDTLFTTAVEFDRYVSIDESREWFVKLLPDIRFCQDTYLCPQIGYELIEALLTYEVSSRPEGLTAADAKVWDVSIQKLKQALALYAENRNEKLRRKTSRAEADLSLERAKDYIRNHQSAFGKAMENSPLYDKALMGDAVQNENMQEHPKQVMNYNPDAEDNAVHALFHYNRIP